MLPMKIQPSTTLLLDLPYQNRAPPSWSATLFVKFELSTLECEPVAYTAPPSQEV